MIQTAHFLLSSTALIAFFICILCLFLPHHVKNKTLFLISGMLFCFLSVCIGILLYSFLISDFSISLVARSSHSSLPLLYKVFALWGSPQGSLMIWSWLLSGYICLFFIFTPKHKRNTPVFIFSVGILLFMLCTLLLFINLYKNPFQRLWPIPLEGNDLTPLLQDQGLSYHPFLLYLGYTGLSIPFAMTTALLKYPQNNFYWKIHLENWTLHAWSWLTLGITAGSFWSYHVLGWGGWWFWDPVESISLIPWFLALSLIHFCRRTTSFHSLSPSIYILGLSGYISVLIGTFIIRSGLLTSVHTFTEDGNATYKLLFMVIISLAPSLIIFLKYHRAWLPKKQVSKKENPISLYRKLASFQGFLSCTAALLITYGILFPIGYEFLTGQKISFGDSFFNQLLSPILVSFLMGLTIKAFLEYRYYKKCPSIGNPTLQPLLTLLLVILLATLLTYFFPLSVLIFLSLVTLISFCIECSMYYYKRKFTLCSFSHKISHFGFILCIIGILLSSTLHVEILTSLEENTPYCQENICLQAISSSKEPGPNYFSDIVSFSLMLSDTLEKNLNAEQRFYYGPQQLMALPTFFLNILDSGVLVYGGRTKDHRYITRFYYDPWLFLVWLSGLLMALGGFVYLLSKRQYP